MATSKITVPLDILESSSTEKLLQTTDIVVDYNLLCVIEGSSWHLKSALLENPGLLNRLRLTPKSDVDPETLNRFKATLGETHIAIPLPLEAVRHLIAPVLQQQIPDKALEVEPIFLDFLTLLRLNGEISSAEEDALSLQVTSGGLGGATYGDLLEGFL